MSSEEHPEALIAAIGDEALEPAGRAQAIDALSTYTDTVPGAAMIAELEDAAGSPDCVLAAAAASMLSQAGHRDHLPTRPVTGDPEVMMSALCVAARFWAEDTDAVMQSYIGPMGLDVIYPQGREPEDSTAYLAYHHDPGALVDPGILEPLAFGTCIGTVCALETGHAELTLTPDLDTGELYLTRIVVHRDLDREKARAEDFGGCGAE